MWFRFYGYENRELDAAGFMPR
ncbi:hypothetical protein NKW51_01400 [Acetobacter lambici]|nr:hypothetical protein [Acetobacter lambici]MCP1241262.1 hypothetical protein [Acetobacter lambici]